MLVGQNVLAVEARNEGGPAGLLAGLHVVQADGSRITELTGPQWTCSPEFAADWREREFNASRWAAAVVVGEYGAQPWGRFDEPQSDYVPEWARPEFEGRDWAPAEIAEGSRWQDVPVELLSEAGVERALGSWLVWGLERFSGYVDYTTAFDVPGDAPGELVLDLGRVLHLAEVWVNGERVGARLWPPFEFELAGKARAGRNELRVRVGNLVVNEMAQFADRKRLGTWGWGAPPQPADYEAGLFGPVKITDYHKAAK